LVVAGVAGCGDDTPEPDAAAVVDTSGITTSGTDGHNHDDTGDDQGTEGPDGPRDTDDGPPDGEDGPPDTDDSGSDDSGDVGCIPDCDGRECGDNACEGVCGECAAGFECNGQGRCDPNSDTCAGALPVGETPWVIQASTTEWTDAGACQGAGAGAPDAFFVMTEAGKFEARVAAAGFDARITTYTDCGSLDACETDSASVLFESAPDAPVYISVDGAAEGESGSFSLTVSSCDDPCGPLSCGPGKCGVQCTCEQGFYCAQETCLEASQGNSCNGSIKPVPDTPFSETVDMATFTNTISCGGAGDGKDVVYVYNPAQQKSVTVIVDGAADSAAWIGSGVCDETLCTGEGKATPAAPVGAVLQQNVDYYIVLEAGSAEKVTLTIVECKENECSADCPCPVGSTCVPGDTGGVSTCQAPSDGDGCSDAVALDAGVTTHSTTLLTNTQSCGAEAGAQDAVFSFTVPTAGVWRVGVSGDHAVALYTLSACGEPASCQNYTTTGAFKQQLSAGESLFVVVDEIGDGAPGGFSLDVTNCTTGCEDQPCDTLVCGDQCGCANNEVCAIGDDGAACAVADAGDSCGTASLLTALPVQVSGTLEGFGDSLGCGADAGLGTPDAIYRFVASETGVYTASVAGQPGTKILLPDACSTGGQACLAPPASKQLFKAHAGDQIILAVDGPAAAYELSIVRVLGLAGSLGGACSTAADCPLADLCFGGVCTLTCDSSGADKACVGATPGPRGTAYGCPKDVCLPGDGGCAAVCVAGVETGQNAGCGQPATCGAGKTCLGLVQDNDSDALSGVCATAGSLSPGDAPCTTAAECQSGLCFAGQCRDLCANSQQCGDDHKCQLTPTPAGPIGTCRAMPVGTSKSACGADSGCPSGQCEGSIAPSGLPEYYCLPDAPDLLANGATCGKDGDCASNLCLFAGITGFNPPYCAEVCPSPADCDAGTTCRPFSIWDGGTPSDPDDDATLKVCVTGAPLATCLKGGAPICDDGLTCTDALGSGPYGACQ